MKYLQPAAVFLLMVSIGMSISLPQFIANWRRLTPRNWLKLRAATFLLPPLLALALGALLPLGPAATPGLFLVAVAPGAPLVTRSVAKKGIRHANGCELPGLGRGVVLAIDPTNKLVEPVANWLIKNRRGAQWSNTRDTAIVVLAMTDYLKASGEIAPDMEYVLTVNGTTVASRKVSGADVFNAPSRFEVDTKLIQDRNEVRIQVKPGKPTPNPSKEGNRRGGGLHVYFAVEAKFFSLEEPIAAAGNEIFVKRQYFRLGGRPTLLKGYVYEKEPLLDGESVKSGERVETVLTIVSEEHNCSGNRP